MNCKLITTASDYAKTEMLRKSLAIFGWEYIILTHEWRGFGDKILKTYEYLKEHPEITHFFYSDSYDTIALQTMNYALSQIEDKDIILMSAERACYPHPEKEALYPKHDSPWHFVNGGGWFCNSEVFKIAVETNPLTYETVDQVWFTDLYLNHPEYVKLDCECKVFQSIAFCPETDFKIITTFEVGREFAIENTVTKTRPTYIHGNGHTPMTEFYKLI